MVLPTPVHDLPSGLVEWLLDGPILRPDRIEAGRRRAVVGPLCAEQLAAAVVAEGPPLTPADLTSRE